MPILLTCRSCEHEFSAWDDLIGKVVPCPNCSADVYVSDGEDEDDWEEGEEEDEDDEFRLAPADENVLRPTSDALPVSGEDETVSEGESKEPVPTYCPQCGADLEGEPLCDACGYHALLKRRIASDIETFKPDENLGFKRWFNSQLAEGESYDSVLFWGKIVFGFLLVVFTFIFFPLSLCLTIPIVILVAGLYMYLKANQRQGDDAFYDAGTRITLQIMRALNWPEMKWPFKRTPSFSAKGTEFTDQDLIEMSNPEAVLALDLEGTDITDAGLTHLAAEWGHLKYLVLLDTKTTRPAVVDLQFQLPRTMIWY